MADYYTPQQLAQRLGVSEVTIGALQAEELLEPTVKNGRVFFSSQQAYRLQIAIRCARRKKLELNEAFACVEERWLARSTARKD